MEKGCDHFAVVDIGAHSTFSLQIELCWGVGNKHLVIKPQQSQGEELLIYQPLLYQQLPSEETIKEWSGNGPN
jgi:hypothetical protein